MTKGPIVVDKNITSIGRFEGMFGAPPEVIILDGKHRHAEAVESKKGLLHAYVGKEVVPYLRSARKAHDLRQVERNRALVAYEASQNGSTLRGLRAVFNEEEVRAIRTRVLGREVKALPDGPWEWFLLSGLMVKADKLQYKDDDGSGDGLNPERRKDSGTFDPMKVPPISVWKDPEGHNVVVDGHKRYGSAKRNGCPVLRGRYIQADSYEDAKKKGEEINEQMGTKAVNRKLTRQEVKAVGGNLGTLLHTYQSSSGKVRNVLEAILYNLGVETPSNPKSIPKKVDEAKLSRQLVAQWESMHDDFSPSELHQYEALMQQLGLTRHLHAGAVTKLDGAYHQGPAGAFTGDKVKVTRSGWVSGDRVLSRARTQKALPDEETLTEVPNVSSPTSLSNEG